MSSVSRREFLEISLSAAAGISLLPLAGCGVSDSGRKGVLEVPPGGYPFVDVSGSHHEIGRQIGSAMRDSIRGHLRYSDDYSNSVTYLEREGGDILRRMLSHTKAFFPHLVEELEGIAESLDIPFMKLFAFNCRSEIRMLQDPPGCSTIALKDENHTILIHNEDGNDLNVGRMFVARVTPPSGVTFLAFVYPGLLAGNGPGFNNRGIVQTTNYIQPRKVSGGVPRYFICRAILEAKSLTEAVELATMKPRAFPFHHNLLSLEEGRILSVETAAWPDYRYDLMEIEGLYIHTNHFLHRTMVEEREEGERPYDVPYISSTTRMEVLSSAVARDGEPTDIDGILKLLSLHEGSPYSPCRHPEGDVHGITLGTAVFQAPDKSMTLYHGNPCMNIRREHTL
jgi:predicted choloylglycine hydrolase